MVVTRSQAADSVAPGEQLGRGCRERKPTQFLEEVYFQAPAARSGHGRPTRAASTESLVLNHRYPQREAARRAAERIRHQELDDTVEELPPMRARKPPVDPHSSAARHARRRQRREGGISSNSDKSSSDSSSDSSDGSSSGGDEAGGVLTEDPLPRVQNAIKRRTSINDVMSQMLSGHKHGKKHGRDGRGVRGEGAGNAVDKRGGNNGDARQPDADALGDITPLAVDPNVNFGCVGGMPQHILLLREMVLLPLLYPKLLASMNVSPPRGVLFVGPPGTGKTLMARALANEGVINGQRRISFFMRKGADILSKWVGESEKQLRLLFDEAKRREPSIIFFDEIDGLAPVRHSKQEQSHAALVSTLLALLDGIDSRGQVIIIGATNRPDTIDPALRRPGRFDRELRFSLPNDAARRHILQIQLGSQSATGSSAAISPAAPEVVDYLMPRTAGWSGAELRALCAEASLSALRRTLPQIYVSPQRLLVAETNVAVTIDDFRVAVRRVQPSVARSLSYGDVGPVDEHLQLLLREVEEEVVGAISARFAPASAALQESTRRCDDLESAVVALGQIPPPALSAALFVALRSDTSTFIADTAAAMLARAFPSFFSRCVHVPNLMTGQHGAAGAAGAGAGAGAGDEVSGGGRQLDATSLGSICESVAAATPAILILSGMEDWVAILGGDEAHMHSALALFRYNLMLLLRVNVIVVVPVTSKATVSLLFPPSVFPPQAVVPLEMPQCASDAARRRMFKHLGALFVAHGRSLMPQPAEWAVLAVDETPLAPPPKSRISRAAAMERWQRIEHKRRQLRLMLRQRIAPLTTGTKFRVLLSKDLDFEPGSAELRGWQRHTRTTRIGLEDVLDKIDNAEYVALSQFNADIEQIYRNVASFFSAARDAGSIRYRSKAAELKELVMIENFKLSKTLVSFCEEHANEDEPASSGSEEGNSDSSGSDDDDEGTVASGTGAAPRTGAAKPQPQPPRRRRRRSWCGGSRRRQRPKAKLAAKAAPAGDEDSDVAELVGNAQGGGEIRAAAGKGTPSPARVRSVSADSPSPVKGSGSGLASPQHPSARNVGGSGGSGPGTSLGSSRQSHTHTGTEKSVRSSSYSRVSTTTSASASGTSSSCTSSGGSRSTQRGTSGGAGGRGESAASRASVKTPRSTASGEDDGCGDPMAELVAEAVRATARATLPELHTIYTSACHALAAAIATPLDSPVAALRAALASLIAVRR